MSFGIATPYSLSPLSQRFQPVSPKAMPAFGQRALPSWQALPPTSIENMLNAHTLWIGEEEEHRSASQLPALSEEAVDLYGLGFDGFAPDAKQPDTEPVATVPIDEPLAQALLRGDDSELVQDGLWEVMIGLLNPLETRQRPMDVTPSLPANDIRLGVAVIRQSDEPHLAF